MLLRLNRPRTYRDAVGKIGPREFQEGEPDTYFYMQTVFGLKRRFRGNPSLASVLVPQHVLILPNGLFLAGVKREPRFSEPRYLRFFANQN